MAKTNFESILTMTCTVQHTTETTTDAHGQPIIDDWTSDQDTGVPCLLEGTASNEVIDGKRIVVKDFNLMLPAGTDITEDSRVVNVARTSDSSVVEAGPLSVLRVTACDEIGGGAHHIEAMMDFVEED